MIYPSFFQRYFLAVFFFLSCSHSWAYFATLDTGEIQASGRNRLLLSPQFVLDKIEGMNLSARFDGGIDDQFGYRFQAGFGTIDFHIGGFAKWVPIPDVDKQPAIGLLAGVLFSNYEDQSHLGLRLHPLVSKKLTVDFGTVTPYASIPIGLDTSKGDTVVPIQLAVGSELQINNLSQDIHLWAEVGFNISKAFSYISLAGSYDFDGI